MHRDARYKGFRRRNSTWALAVLPHPEGTMIRKLKSGQYRLYSRKVDPKTHKRRNLGTFDSREAAERHEREVQFFKRN
jgi:hypothetical protein